jgi:hypothetical protein
MNYLNSFIRKRHVECGIDGSVVRRLNCRVHRVIQVNWVYSISFIIDFNSLCYGSHAVLLQTNEYIEVKFVESTSTAVEGERGGERIAKLLMKLRSSFCSNASLSLSVVDRCLLCSFRVGVL